MRTIEELTDGEELCKYCPLPDEAKGIHGAPNGYTACEGCRCQDAYEAYKEECTEFCVNCNAQIHPDEAEFIQIAVDNEIGPLCSNCAGEG